MITCKLQRWELIRLNRFKHIQNSNKGGRYRLKNKKLSHISGLITKRKRQQRFTQAFSRIQLLPVQKWFTKHHRETVQLFDFIYPVMHSWRLMVGHIFNSIRQFLFLSTLIHHEMTMQGNTLISSGRNYLNTVLRSCIFSHIH